MAALDPLLAVNAPTLPPQLTARPLYAKPAAPPLLPVQPVPSQSLGASVPVPPSAPTSQAPTSAPASTGVSSRRQINSCQECHQVFVCWLLKRTLTRTGDKTVPCQPCKARGDADSCAQVEKHDAASAGCATIGDLERLLRRVADLEDLVGSLRHSRLPPIYDGPGRDGMHRDRLPPLYGASEPPRRDALEAALPSLTHASIPPRPPPVAPPNPDEDAAMMLEDFAMGNRANMATRTSDTASGTGSGTAAAGQAANGASTDLSTAVTASQSIAPSHPLAFLIDPNGLSLVSRALAVAPDNWQAQMLVKHYLRRLDWAGKILHNRTFLAECETLWQAPPGDIASVRPAFLSVYFSVLTLALYLSDPEQLAHMGFSASEASRLCAACFSAAQGLFWFCDPLGNGSIEHLQSVVLMGAYQYSEGQGDSHYTLLGAAISIARNLGLNRLGVESDAAGRKWPERWRTPVQREIGRRIWWSLAFLDFSHAFAHGMAYSIHADQNLTGFPLNVSDATFDAAGDGGALVEQPLDVYTEMSYLLCRLRFVLMYRRIVDHVNATRDHDLRTHHKVAQEMDAHIRSFLETLPPFFRASSLDTSTDNSVQDVERIMIQLIGQTRLMRLHRPLLAKGYRDPAFAQSRDKCVAAAQEILNLVRDADTHSIHLLHSWMVIFYAFAAGVVLFLDLCRGERGGPEASRARKELERLIRLFKAVEQFSAAARNAAHLLTGLLEAERQLDSGSNSASIPVSPDRPHKRARFDVPQDDDEAEDGPFRQVVKRLLTESTSPQPQLSPSASDWPASADANGAVADALGASVDFNDLTAWFAAPVPPLGSGDHFGLHALLAPGGNSGVFAGASGNPSRVQSPTASGAAPVDGAELQNLFSDDLGVLDGGSGGAAAFSATNGWAARNGQLQ